MIADGDYKVTVRYIQWPGPNAQCRGRAIQDLQASEWTDTMARCSHTDHPRSATTNLWGNLCDFCNKQPAPGM